jgi:hypothetical protein
MDARICLLSAPERTLWAPNQCLSRSTDVRLAS